MRTVIELLVAQKSMNSNDFKISVSFAIACLQLVLISFIEYGKVSFLSFKSSAILVYKVLNDSGKMNVPSITLPSGVFFV